MSTRQAPPSQRGPPRSVRGSRRPGESGTSKTGVSRTGKSTAGRGSTLGKTNERQSSEPPVFLDGLDVTPRSLISAAQQAVGKTFDGSESGSHQSSAVESGFGKGGAAGISSIGSDDGMGGGKTPELQDASASEVEGAESAVSSKPKAATPAAAEETPAPAALTAAELESYVSFELSETETFFLLDMPGECVALDSPEIEGVKAQNAAYDTLLEKRVTMADMYVESPAQTFNLDQKPKEMQTYNVPQSEMGTQASEWEIYDAYVDDRPPAEDADGVVEVATAAGGGGGGGGGAAGTSAAGGEGSSFAASGTETSMVESSMAAGGEEGMGEEGAPAAGAKAVEVSLKSFGPSLLGVLRIVERMVSQNTYQAKHLQYRHIEPPQLPGIGAEKKMMDALAEGGALGASMAPLWSFISDEKTAGRNVSCLEWNPGNPDLLAAGYGEFDFAKQSSEGLIGFWSLKNPDSADKMIRTACGVTAIAFSHSHPNLLGVGLYDGTVAIYDVRKVEKVDAKPMLESGHGSGGKHTDPVWQLVWVDQGAEKGEILVSISSDGRVTKWDMKKGLENTDLMKLKRVAAPSKGGQKSEGGGGGSEGIISRRASGMCVAFHIRDHNIYLAGTEDGHIHKCSCSYSEQHLESFFGHSGPVYKLRWSPFSPNTFLSCSADWTIKLWDQDSHNAIFTFSSTTDYVADISWSPNNSTVFASVTGDGRVDVWDISVNTLDPLTSISTGLRLSTIAFSQVSSVIVVGHDGGGVDVYSLEGSLAEPMGRTVQEQIDALDKVTATVQDEAPVAVH